MMVFMVSKVKQSLWKRVLKYGIIIGKFWVVVGELNLKS